MGKSSIEWTEETWNPATGCTQISTGCKNCYASALSKRLKAMGQKKYVNGFKYTEHEESLETPFNWKRSRKIFVNSMSDLFHENATDEFISKVFYTMLKADWHTYQILTKRPQRMRDFVAKLLKIKNLKELPNHIWLGTSVENQAHVWRIEYLKQISCIRFVSFEPLLGPIETNLTGIHWAITGGESGANFRPVEKDWIVSTKKICDLYKVPWFFKQWGGLRPKSGGKVLDGKTYQNYPKLKILA